MGKLIIHIGPPKTASTSLQYYLESLNQDGVKYIGVNQPRETDSMAFGTAVHTALLESDTFYDIYFPMICMSQ